MFSDFTGKTLVLHGVALSSTVAQLRQRLVNEKRVPEHDLRMIYAGKQLEDDETLFKYGVAQVSASRMIFMPMPMLTKVCQQNCTIHLVARMRGGDQRRVLKAGSL